MKENNILTLLIIIVFLAACSPTPAKPDLPPETPKAASTEDSEENSEQVDQVKLEKNDWSDIWIENANQSEKSRILFVGDSITNGYYSLVKENLTEEYYLGYYVTSKFLGNPDFQTELTTILDRYDFEIVHINNGLHGWDYSIDEYQKGLEDLKGILDDHAENALIIWAMTTPVRVEENLEFLDKLNQDVILRNQSALEILGENGILINDLYQGMLKHREYYRDDGIHFNDAGKRALAELVLEFILSSR